MPEGDIRPGLRRMIARAIDLLDTLDADADAEPDADHEPEPEIDAPPGARSEKPMPANDHGRPALRSPRATMTSAITLQHRLVSQLDERLVTAEAVAMSACAFVRQPAGFEALNAISLALEEGSPEAAADFLAASGTSPSEVHTSIALLEALTASVLAWSQHIKPTPASPQD